MIRDDFHLEAIVMRDKPFGGKTLIEKFEDAAEPASYAFALMTPDDQVDAGARGHLQARPNVIFELGWFYGRLGREKVCIIFNEKMTIHSDLDGMGTIRFKDDVTDKRWEIRQELVAAEILSV
jgi:predicted nucleotide-binding protein